MPATATPMPSTPHRQRSLPILLGALTAFSPLSIDMYLPSLPTIQHDLATSASATQRTLAAFFAGLGLAQLAYGPLADRFGRRRPLFAGIALYVLASLGCAFAPDIHTLIALRFLQAVGGAAGPVVARAVVRDLHRGAEAARLLSLLMLIMGAAPILAPLAGGWVLHAAGWRAIFHVLAAIGLACLVFAALALPETGAPGGSGAGFLPGLRAVWRDPQFAAFTLAGGFSQAAMFAYISGSPFVYIQLFHVSPRAFAWFFGTNAFGLITASQVNRRLLARASPARLLVTAATAALAVGTVLAGVALAGRATLPTVAASLFAFLTCLGFIGPNATALALEEQGARAGLASAALGSTQFAIAAVASLLVSGFIDGTLRPMALVMAACGAAAWALGLRAARRVAVDGDPEVR
jgi:DHA1 family bicyclomycin/chloramphenicol resistance-like MFS transporter